MVTIFLVINVIHTRHGKIKIGKNDIRKASYSWTPALPAPTSGSSQQYWKNFVIEGLKKASWLGVLVQRSPGEGNIRSLGMGSKVLSAV